MKRVLLALLFLTGCPNADVVEDTGLRDLGPKDAALDTGADSGIHPDAESPDAEPMDAEEPDAEMDAAGPDADEPPDADVDAGEDAGEVDADGGDLDAEPMDVGVPPPAPLAEGALAFTGILALTATPAVDALRITNVSTSAVRLDSLVLRVQSAGGGDLVLYASNDPTGAGAVPVVLLAGASATGIANRGATNAAADFQIGAASALPESFLEVGDRIELSNAGGPLIDAVDFTATATAGQPGPNDFPIVTNVAARLDLQAVTSSAAAMNDSGASWCVVVAGPEEEHPDCDRFLINEVLYDYDSPQDGNDGGREFVEIVGPVGGSLSGVMVTAVEGGAGNGGMVDGEFPLGLDRMPIGDGFFVLADEFEGETFVPNADLALALDLENGPDAIQLVRVPISGPPVLLDALAYGAVAVSVDLVRGLALGEGTPVPDPVPGIYSIDWARASYADTGDNLADFAYDPSPTPGAANDGANLAVLDTVPGRAPAGSIIDVVFTGTDFTDGMTVSFAQIPPPTVSCPQPFAADTLECTVEYPAGGPLTGEAVAVTLTTRPELGASTMVTFLWLGANNETDVGAECDFCNLQFPATLSTTAGVPTSPVYGQIYEAGLTDVTAGAPAPGIIAELGHGPLGTDPRDSAEWIWTPAVFNVEAGPNGNNDEYQGTLTVPAAGSYLYTYRYSLDGGLNFSYGDTDGAGSNGGLDFSAAQLGTLTVN